MPPLAKGRLRQRRKVIGRLVSGLVLFAALLQTAWAEEVAAPDHQFQLFVENDKWFGQSDRYYTNGIKFGLGNTLPESLRQTVRDFLPRFDPINDERDIGLFFGQSIYTPKVITNPAPQPLDHPWTAFLYAGFVAQQAHRDANQHTDRLDTVEIDIGVVGPLAQGQLVQTDFHKSCCTDSIPRGWRNQLPTEPAFMATFLRKWRPYEGNFVDVVPHAGVTLGTMMTLARVGGIVRIGYHLSGFGPDSIEPGGAMLQSNRRKLSLDQPWDGIEAYLFAGVDQRLVAYNLSLDGTVFHDSPHVNRRPHVYDFQTGAVVRWRGLDFFGVKAVNLSLLRIRRSEEFYTAAGGGGPQVFGSINLGLEW